MQDAMASELNNSKEPSNSNKFLAVCKKYLQSFVPITSWLPKYKWKEYVMGDVMAGLTLGCLHIPQSLAFATLAKADPIFGLYTSCFSVIVYCLFGTAVISSFGPVAVASILTGEAVSNYSGAEFTNNELVTTITLLVGVYYFIGFILRFSVVTKLFTKYLTSSFILACCIQIIVKTIKTILGLSISEERGYFSLIFNFYNTFKDVADTNLLTLGISVAVFIVFILNTHFIRPWMKERTAFILPVEILVMIIVTAVSYLANFDELEVELIGEVPTGFPAPKFPNVNALPVIWVEALIISVVNFSTTLSVTLMFNKDLRTGQELFALATTNIICSSFSTLPFGNSMMRTAVARSCGIKTLLCSVVSSGFVLLVILFIGPAFSYLPRCVLGCVIIYGLSLLMVTKLKEIPQILKSGFENSMIWTVTFLVSMLVSIQVGLLCGLILTSRQFLAEKPVTPPKTIIQPANGETNASLEQEQLLEVKSVIKDKENVA